MVDVTLVSEADTPTGTARLVQLSRRGFRLELDPTLAVGETVRVAFRLPNCQDTLLLVGRVTWCEGGAVGAEMQSLAPAQEECLRDLIEA